MSTSSIYFMLKYNQTKVAYKMQIFTDARTFMHTGACIFN